MSVVHVAGMHGCGDTVHARAIIRQLMERETVVLETPWPSIYSDMVGPRLHLISKGSSLRTQAKNTAREAHLFSTNAPKADRTIKLWYMPEAVRRHGSVLHAMMESANCDTADDQFRLPITQAWQDKADTWRARWQMEKPLLIYRPLVSRTEWGGCAARNPDAEAYRALIESIRRDYFVLSLADLEPGKEWISGGDIDADVKCHSGELDFETIAALASRAALVFCSPGFMAPLAQSVGTAVAVVFGGYEDGRSFSAGAKYAPYLPIEPIEPCCCFSHHHACKKAIDVPAAIENLRRFADAHA